MTTLFPESNIRTDIVLIPHLYNIKWSQDLHRILSQRLWCPIPPTFDSYLPSRTLQHRYIANLLPVLRSKNIKTVFYVNILEDFSPDIFKAGFVKNIYGILHGTNFSKQEPGALESLQKYEIALSEMTTKIFTSTKWLASCIPYPVEPIGLPIDEEEKEPKSNNQILFNHRLAKEKDPLKLLELPKDLMKDVVITAPKFTPVYVNKLRKKFKRLHINATVKEYKSILDASGFGISFAKYDNFGYALCEGVMNGLLYFVPENETTAYAEMTIPEVRFSTMDDLVSKIRHYKNRPKERRELVKRSQEKISKFKKDAWLNNLLKKLEV